MRNVSDPISNTTIQITGGAHDLTDILCSMKSNPKTIRAFVAIPLDDVARQFARRYVEELRNAPWANEVKWVAVEDVHVTLRFLGDVSPVQIAQLTDKLSAALRASTSTGAFTLTLTEPRFFPKPSRPRVIACMIELHSRLQHLSQIVESCAVAIGLKPEERGFHGHITLGRCRESFPRMASLSVRPAKSEMKVDEIVLFRSELRRNGAFYTPLHHFKLNAEMSDS